MNPMKNRRLLLILLGFSMLLLACNLGRQVPSSVALQPTATPGGSRATSIPLLPSITPLFGGSVATAVPGSSSSIGAQTVGTPGLGVTLGVTLAPGVVRTPGTVTVSIPTGQITDFLGYVVQNIILPVLNLAVGMVASSATYLWQLAAQRGGWIAQVGCCIAPIVVIVLYLLRGGRRRRGRLFGIF
jgi:hypothetical protein